MKTRNLNWTIGVITAVVCVLGMCASCSSDDDWSEAGNVKRKTLATRSYGGGEHHGNHEGGGNYNPPVYHQIVTQKDLLITQFDTVTCSVPVTISWRTVYDETGKRYENRFVSATTSSDINITRRRNGTITYNYGVSIAGETANRDNIVINIDNGNSNSTHSIHYSIPEAAIVFAEKTGPCRVVNFTQTITGDVDIPLSEID